MFRPKIWPCLTCWLIHSMAKKLGLFRANISWKFITWHWRHRSQHFSPGASECELTSEAYSLTDGNWPEGSVSLWCLLYYSKLGRQSGLHLSAQTMAPKVPVVSTILTAQSAQRFQGVCPWAPHCPKPPRCPKCPSFEPLTSQVLSAWCCGNFVCHANVMQHNKSKKDFGIKYTFWITERHKVKLTITKRLSKR